MDKTTPYLHLLTVLFFDTLSLFLFNAFVFEDHRLLGHELAHAVQR